MQQEEATKTCEFVDLAMSNVLDLIAGMSEADIQANEERLHLQLKKYSDMVAVVQSIWIYGTDGHTLVTSRLHPPPAQSFSDRDFFKVHVDDNVGIYYGQVYTSSFNGEPYFTVSKRIVRDGVFTGVLEVSIRPSIFFRFFSALAYEQGLQYALVREDGLFLARYPTVPPGAPNRLDQRTGFGRTVGASPPGGFYSSTSPVDGIDRRYAIRRLGTLPLISLQGSRAPLFATSGLRPWRPI